MAEFIAYIDESGDEGVHKGTQWFVLAAVIVESGKSSSIVGQKLREIKSAIDLRKPVLHWSDLSHPRKVKVCEELASSPITICAVLVDTYHPDMKSSTLSGVRLYFYAFRWLVERITWFCADEPNRGKVRLRPENKAGISYGELRDYLSFIQTLPDCQVRHDCIIDVQPKSKPQLRLLQVSDSVAGALAEGLEKKYGNIEPRYILTMKNLLYRRDGRLWGYGLKFMPHKGGHIPEKLIPEYGWLASL